MYAPDSAVWKMLCAPTRDADAREVVHHDEMKGTGKTDDLRAVRGRRATTRRLVA